MHTHRVPCCLISSQFSMMRWKQFPSLMEWQLPLSHSCNSIWLLSLCLFRISLTILLAGDYEQVLQAREYCKCHQAYEGERPLEKAQVVGEKTGHAPKGVPAQRNDQWRACSYELSNSNWENRVESRMGQTSEGLDPPPPERTCWRAKAGGEVSGGMFALTCRIALIDKNMKAMPKLIEETRKVGGVLSASFLGGLLIQNPHLPRY